MTASLATFALAVLAPGDPEVVPLSARVDQALAAGVAWLVENQEPSGAWGSHHTIRPYELTASVPGTHDAFRVATTGLAVAALHRAAPGAGPDGEDVRRAVDRGVDHLLEYHVVGRASGLEHFNVWSLGYGLLGLAEHLLQRPDDPRADAILAACAATVARLERCQHLDGGWGYLSLFGIKTARPSDTSMSFTTASLLLAMERASRLGIEASPACIERAVRSIERCRMPSGAYSYGELWNRRPAMSVNLPKGAACRTPNCMLALEAFGREIPLAARRHALEDLLVRHARFQEMSLRRPIPHESWYGVSGYFYLFGHAYAAWMLDGMPAEDRARFGPALAEAVLLTRQPDGSFWDYPMYSYHGSYGTAYALIALARLSLDV